ncbi:MAG: hypothetical protein AVO33_00840 [delta proteobacterium ML8_F1]|nr:MAG: hypothetical protein AVO33_00840 [delta proteobacterium ML8_F1]
MKILVDTHVHTLASGHAYSTLNDYIEEAKIKGLEMFALTDHGIRMPGGPDLYHFYNQIVIPREVGGIKILRGIEANMIDFEGSLDGEDRLLDQLDLVIGSVHPICLPGGGKREYTKGAIAMMASGKIQVLGHPGNAQAPVEIEEVVRAAREYQVAIEINNSSFLTPSRRGSEENCARFCELGHKHGVPFVVSSDAHVRYDLGVFDGALALIDQQGVDESLIVNTNAEKFIEFLKRKGKLKNDFNTGI